MSLLAPFRTGNRSTGTSGLPRLNHLPSSVIVQRLRHQGPHFSGNGRSHLPLVGPVHSQWPTSQQPAPRDARLRQHSNGWHVISGQTTNLPPDVQQGPL